MRSEAQAEALPADPQQAEGHAHVARELGQPEPFKDVLRDRDLMRRLGIQRASFQERKAAGEFDCFMLRGPHARARSEYSGYLFAEWLRTGDLPVRSFAGARRVQTRRSLSARKLRPVT